MNNQIVDINAGWKQESHDMIYSGFIYLPPGTFSRSAVFLLSVMRNL